MVLQVFGTSAGNDQHTTRFICPTIAGHQML